MAIPETQLETWSHQGSVAQSRDTYAAVKRALEAPDADYAGKSFEVYLQGSYGNDTNTYSESDVDVVIQLNSVFHHDLSELSSEQKSAFDSAYEDGGYSYPEFKGQVIRALTKCFGAAVEPGQKAVKIKAGGARRSADVIIATQFRRYHSFLYQGVENFDRGICFWSADGERIVNFPKQHSANCTKKHQATSGYFKPMVRILKNMRRRLVQTGELKPGIAPSYFLEGLLYNVPDTLFGSSYGDTFVEAFNWIANADQTQFLCANEQYYLLRDTSVTWAPADFTAFLNKVGEMWEDWGERSEAALRRQA